MPCDIGIELLSLQGGESKGVTDSVLADILGSVATEAQYTAGRGSVILSKNAWSCFN